MLNLSLRKEFQGKNMPGTTIALHRGNSQGAIDKTSDEFLKITYPTADVIKALKTVRENRDGISQNDLESRGWIKVHGREVDVVSIADRYAMLTKRGLTRKHIKTDLDQTFFLMGMVLARKNLINELETGNLKLKKSVQDILKWFHQTSEDPIIRQAASSVITLMAQFEQDQKAKATVQEQPSLFDFMDEEE